jgi:predicted ArsR family transcriptional regulator
MHTTRRAILEILQARGSASVEDLAQATGLAPVTMRHHLGLLRDQELVDHVRQPVGRGRPRHIYHATTRASALLAGNPYESLVARLLVAIKGEDRSAAARIFERLGWEIAAYHEAELAGLSTEERLDQVVRLLSDEGFVVRWERDGDGTYLVQEFECPYERLSGAHAEVCCLDQRLMETALEAEVVREQWRPAGDPSCRFRVRVAVADGADQAGVEEL